MSSLPPPPETPSPQAAPAAEPPRGRRIGRLEIGLVALALVGGVATTAAAAATVPDRGGSEATGPTADGAIALPTGSTGPTGFAPTAPTGPTGFAPTGPTATGPATEGSVEMFFSEWRFVPSGFSTCEGDLSIEWGVEDSGDLPIGRPVVISVEGPGISRTVREPLTERGVSIVIHVPPSNTGRVVAIPESVGDRAIDGFVRVVAEDFC